jgi:predicted  nucleic acid-binding Zn-ribbon protein
MEPVGEYVQQIDRLLAAGAAMFPDHQPTATAEQAAHSTPVLPDGPSGLTTAVQQADARYRDIDARIAEITTSIDQAVKFAATQALQAGVHARSIRDTAQSQAEAITSAAKTSDCVGEMVSTMDERLAAMQNHIASTREQLRATATQIRQLSVELSAASAAARQQS